MPNQLKTSQFVYLANNDPIQNINLLKQFINPKLVVCDTIEFWIQTRPDAVKKMFGMVHGVIINDQEKLRMLCGMSNLIKCAKEILSWGPEFVIVKKGEHGSVLVRSDMILLLLLIPGRDRRSYWSGDSFAGGFMGHLASIETNGVIEFRSAVVYGNVMGSFAVEDFGLNRLLSIDKEEISKDFISTVN